jgi:hypothetical protein
MTQTSVACAAIDIGHHKGIDNQQLNKRNKSDTGAA